MALDESLELFDDDEWLEDEFPELMCPFCGSEDITLVRNDLYRCNECGQYHDEADDGPLMPVLEFEELL